MRLSNFSILRQICVDVDAEVIKHNGGKSDRQSTLAYWKQKENGE